MSLDKLKVCRLKETDLTFPWGIESQIKFEPAKPKEEMFKGCYNE